MIKRSKQRKSTKRKWTKDEDLLLKKNVNLYQKNSIINWKKVSSKIPNRNQKQCNHRWHSQLDPDINKGKFSTKEIITIIEKQEKFGNRWKKIADFLKNRVDLDVKNYWNSHIKKNKHLYKEEKQVIKCITDPTLFSKQIMISNNEELMESFNDDFDTLKDLPNPLSLIQQNEIDSKDYVKNFNRGTSAYFSDILDDIF